MNQNPSNPSSNKRNTAESLTQFHFFQLKSSKKKKEAQGHNRPQDELQPTEPSPHTSTKSKVINTARQIARPIVYVAIVVEMAILAIYGGEWSVQATPIASIGSYSDFFYPVYTANLFSRKIALLNFFIYVFIFFLFIALTNRFWVGMGLFGTLIVIWMTANRIKVPLRHEAVLPSDLQIAGGGQAGNVGSFIPPESRPLLWKAAVLIILIWIGAVVIRLLLGKGRLVHFHQIAIHIAMRILLFIVPLICFILFSNGLSSVESPVYKLAHDLDDMPDMSNTVADAEMNGTVVSFLRLSSTSAITKPPNYSSVSMKNLERKYSNAAKQINQSRSSKMTNNTVIGVLSESFSDPTRVPGVKIGGGDPMPNIRALKSQTTSGYMLSSGYGGGTANLEFQELTGITTTVFNASAISPYLQVVPHQTKAFSFNQMWNIADFGSPNPIQTSTAKKAIGSIAIHPYSSGMYQRRTNFMQKFLFRSFYTLDGPQYMKHTKKLDRSSYVCDQQSYQEVLDRLSADTSQRQLFIQLTTMQNHMPFVNQWNNNQFTASSTTSKKLSDTEATAIRTAAKGFNITDQATADWLSKLDKMKRPITVVWYGDHLPGIYDDAMENPANMITLHETDYFIWSNVAARAEGAATKLPADDTTYISPNYLMALAAEHLNAKVSPYIAFLTLMHQQIPAMEPALSTGDWFNNIRIVPNTYLDKTGKRIDTKNMTKAQKQMLSDYHKIAYDTTLGNHYLEKAGFTKLPK